MVIHIPICILCIWEISHRWHGFDPNESDPNHAPRPVRERIRQLLQALTYGLLPYDVYGEEILVDELWFSGIRRNRFGKTLDRHLHQGLYDKKFLESVFIRHDELEKWCWRVNQTLPEFWFPDQVNRWGAIHEDDIPQIDTPHRDERTAVSAIAKKAAQKRHEPLNQLKFEFCEYWIKGQFRSRADAARLFHKSLPPERKKLLVESNAVRTLTQALAKHLPPKDKQ